MYAKGQEQRRAIVEAADRLFYERGYAQTSFSDIAAAASFNRGNFYHYFKTKDDILEAVIAARLARAGAMLSGWRETLRAPRERLGRFVGILSDEAADVVRFGSPAGTLIGEMAKRDPARLATVRAMFDLFLGWLEEEFRALGYGEEARLYARRLLALTEGAGLIAQTYGDEAYLRHEALDIARWIDGLAAG